MKICFHSFILFYSQVGVPGSDQSFKISEGVKKYIRASNMKYEVWKHNFMLATWRHENMKIYFYTFILPIKDNVTLTQHQLLTNSQRRKTSRIQLDRNTELTWHMKARWDNFDIKTWKYTFILLFYPYNSMSLRLNISCLQTVRGGGHLEFNLTGLQNLHGTQR